VMATRMSSHLEVLRSSKYMPKCNTAWIMAPTPKPAHNPHYHPSIMAPTPKPAHNPQYHPSIMAPKPKLAHSPHYHASIMAPTPKPAHNPHYHPSVTAAHGFLVTLCGHMPRGHW
jgi:hypothetical protein